jgi:hypothetical protein
MEIVRSQSTVDGWFSQAVETNAASLMPAAEGASKKHLSHAALSRSKDENAAWTGFIGYVRQARAIYGFGRYGRIQVSCDRLDTLLDVRRSHSRAVAEQTHFCLGSVVGYSFFLGAVVAVI